MRRESPDLTENTEEASPLGFERGDLNISDGMDPVSVPPRITKANFASIFGSTLPDGLSEDMLENGGLELNQS